LRPGQDVAGTLVCPEATEASNGMPASALHAWGPETLWDAPGKPRGTFIGSYGFNGWLYAPDAETGAPPRQPPADAAAVPVVFDGARWELFPRDTDQPKLFRPGATGSDGWLQLAALERHKRSTNVAFLDGHAETIAPSALWRAK